MVQTHAVRGQYKSLLLPLFIAITIFSPKCGHHTPPLSSPNIGTGATESLNVIVKQADETQDFVARLKGKADLTPQQLEYASDKYARIVIKVNPLVDLIKQNVTNVPNVTEMEFKNQATTAVDTNVQFSTLAEGTIHSTQNFNNFVLTNANSLPGAWTLVWKAIPTLSLEQRQQLITFLDSRLRYKSWDSIKKK